MEQFDITSTHNPCIKSVMHLQKRRERDRAGLFMIEGAREIGRSVRGGVTLEEVFVCPPLATGEEERETIERIQSRGITITSVTRRVFARIAYRETTGGLTAVAVKPRFALTELPRTDFPLYLIVAGVEKPGNLGAILRSADGAGVTGLIVTDPGTDLCNPNIIRSSLGTIFTVPVAASVAGEAIGWLRDKPVCIIASSPHAGIPYTDADLSSACAIVVGSEDTGVGEDWLDAADLHVAIPMRGVADSLNVSAAAAVLLYEARRQRAGTPRVGGVGRGGG